MANRNNQNTFELRSKKFFFTYSDCEKLHETCLAKIRDGFAAIGRRIVKYIVAREWHSDGLRHHLHCYIETDIVIRERIPANHFDIDHHHPNIAGCKSPKRVIKYVTKDQNYITNDREMVDEAIKSEEGSRDKIGEAIMKGMPILELCEKWPKLAIGYARLKVDIQAFQADKTELEPALGPCGVWIGGTSGVGKSFFAAITLPKEFACKVYDKPNNEKFWPGFNNEPIVVAQDVDRSWKPCCEAFKKWADGYPFIGESKGGHIKARLSLFVVTSNLTLDEYLSECKIGEEYAVRKPWLRRFLEYYVTDREEFGGILEKLKSYFKK